VLPRLAVLSVLSAASSPCPDLNLIHYTIRFIYLSGCTCLRGFEFFLLDFILKKGSSGDGRKMGRKWIDV